MLPKRSCPFCNQQTVKFSSMIKNLFMLNEGTECSSCGYFILVKRTFSIGTLSFLFTIVNVVIFFFNLLYIFPIFTNFMNTTSLNGTLLLVFINLLFMFVFHIFLTLIYCYKVPIEFSTEKEIDEGIEKERKWGVLDFVLNPEVLFLIFIAGWAYFS